MAVMLITKDILDDLNNEGWPVQNGEYMNHIFANTFHFVSITLILAAKPLDAWAFGPSTILDRPYPEITSWICGAFVPGGIIATIMHFWQWSQFVTNK